MASNRTGGGLTFVRPAAGGADTKGQYYGSRAYPVKPAEPHSAPGLKPGAIVRRISLPTLALPV
ncbi:hypothetical protein J2Y42_003476 [Leifsonia sp. 1010]|nr:hypothetical protein [Leifsonia sp. 1010]